MKFKKKIDLPELSELEIVRHFSRLERKNFSIDTHFYPLGSCTMKYNPRACEKAAGNSHFAKAHPLAPHDTVEGTLELSTRLLEELCRICGMDTGSLAPNAGAQGELAGMLMIKQARPDRSEIIVPDSAHGTNPATARMAGFKVVTVKSDAQGDIDIDALKSAVSDKTAGLMLTNPNTLGLFSRKIKEIAKTIHDAGGLCYYDGANLNSILEICRPGDMGFDVMHINLHKTFSTPHGGGGPGSGPVLCKDHLKQYLPNRLHTFNGNYGTLLRAYCYILMKGPLGLREVSEKAVANANYLKEKLDGVLTIPFSGECMHEFVAQPKGITALDLAKRLIEYGIHPPTTYFPLIVKEALLIEPTECVSQDELDAFVDAIKAICSEDPATLKNAPQTTPVTRLDEVKAAKDLVVTTFDADVHTS